MQTLKPFIAGKANREVLGSLDSAKGELLLFGPKSCGKTTLLRTLAQKRNETAAETALFCSSVELVAAIFIRENEQFLASAAERSLLVIDDIELFLQHEQGDKILALLTAERRRSALLTILAANEPAESLLPLFSETCFENFDIKSIAPLSKNDYPDYIDAMIEYYSLPSSPTIDGEGRNIVLKMAKGQLEEIENAVRYLLTASGYSADVTITAEMAKTLLSA